MAISLIEEFVKQQVFMQGDKYRRLFRSPWRRLRNKLDSMLFAVGGFSECLRERTDLPYDRLCR